MHLFWEAARCTSAAPTYWRPYSREIELLFYFKNDKNLQNDLDRYLHLYKIKKQGYEAALNDTKNKIEKLSALVTRTSEVLYNPSSIQYYESVDLLNRENTLNQLVYQNKRKVALETLILDSCIRDYCSLETSIFKHKLKNAWVMVDGGFGNNNPTLLAYTDMVTLGHKINYVLSISAGEEQTYLDDNNMFNKFRDANFKVREKESIILRIAIAIQSLLTGLYETMTLIINDKDLEADYDNVVYQISEIDKKISSDISQADKEILLQEKGSLQFLASNLSSYANKTTSISAMLKVVAGEKNVDPSIIDTIVNNIGGIQIPDIIMSEDVKDVKEKSFSLLSKIKKIGTGISSIKKYRNYFDTMMNIITFIMGKIKFQQFNDNLVDILNNVRGKDMYVESILDKFVTTMAELEKEASIANSDFSKFKEILINDVWQQKSTFLDQASTFLGKNLIGAVTGTNEINNVISSLLTGAYHRINPIYEEEIDLAETNPLKLLVMMKYVHNYIVNNEALFTEVSDKIVNLTRNKVGTDTVVRAHNEVQQIGIFIQRNLQYERERLHNILKIDLSNTKTYYFLSDIIYLDNIIDYFYRNYYEAHYTLLKALQNYTRNNVLGDNNEDIYMLEYMNMLTFEIITKRFSLSEIKNILEGTNTTQKGGSLNIIKFIEIMNDEEESYLKIQNIKKMKKILNEHNIISKIGKHNIDNLILAYMVKRTDRGIQCDICSKSAGAREMTHYCTLLNEVFNESNDKSNTTNYWNTCRNLSSSLKNTYVNVDQSTNRIIQRIDDKITKDFKSLHVNLHELFIDDKERKFSLSGNDNSELLTSTQWIYEKNVITQLYNTLDPKNIDKTAKESFEILKKQFNQPSNIQKPAISYRKLKTVKVDTKDTKFKYIFDCTLYTKYSTLLNIGDYVRNGIIKFATTNVTYATNALFTGLHIALNIIKNAGDNSFIEIISKKLNVPMGKTTELLTNDSNNIYKEIQNNNSEAGIYIGFIMHNILIFNNLPLFYVQVTKNVVNYELIENSNSFSSYCSIMTKSTNISHATFSNISINDDTVETPNIYPLRRKKILLEMLGFIHYDSEKNILYENDYLYGTNEQPVEYYDLIKYSHLPIEYYSHITIKSPYLQQKFSGTIYLFPYIYYKKEKINIFSEHEFFNSGIGLFRSEYLIRDNSLVILSELDKVINFVKKFVKPNMEDIKAHAIEYLDNQIRDTIALIDDITKANKSTIEKITKLDKLIDTEKKLINTRKKDIDTHKKRIKDVNAILNNLRENINELKTQYRELHIALRNKYAKSIHLEKLNATTTYHVNQKIEKILSQSAQSALDKDLIEFAINNGKEITEIKKLKKEREDVFIELNKLKNENISFNTLLERDLGDINQSQRILGRHTTELEKLKQDSKDNEINLEQNKIKLQKYYDIINDDSKLHTIINSDINIYNNMISKDLVYDLFNSNKYLLMGYKLFFSLYDDINSHNKYTFDLSEDKFYYSAMPIPIFDTVDDNYTVYKVYIDEN